MGDTGEAHTGNETASEARNLDSLTHQSKNKDVMPHLWVAVDDDGGDSADRPPTDEVTTPHLRVALHNDEDEDEDMSGEEHEDSDSEGQGEEQQEEEENGDKGNPMEDPAVKDADTLSSVRIVAHVTDGMADSDTGEQLAFPEEQYDEESEEERREDHDDDHDENPEDDQSEGDCEEDNGDNRAVVHVQAHVDNHEETHEDDHEADHAKEDGENRAMVHVQGRADNYEVVNGETRAVVHMQGHADNDEEKNSENRAMVHVQGRADNYEVENVETRAVAHVQGQADNDEEENSETRAVVHMQGHADNDEEENGETRAVVHMQGHADNDEEENGETRAVVHMQGHADNDEDNHEEDYELDHDGYNGETRAVVNVQGYTDNHEEAHDEQHKVQDEGGTDQKEGFHVMSHSEDEQETDQQRKEDELRTLINIGEESDFEGDKTEGEAGYTSMNGESQVEENVLEQPTIAAVEVNGEQPAQHDQTDVTEELLHAGHSSVTQHDHTDSTSTIKPAAATATEKRKSRLIIPHSKAARPSSAPAFCTRGHPQPESDGSFRAKRTTPEEGEASDGVSQSGGAAHSRPSVRASRTKLTIPQPFHLATEKRASLGGRPAESGALKPRTSSHMVRRSYPATPTKTAGVTPGGIRAAPTEISKEDQEALETLEKDREAKLEEEIAALRIKSGNPSGFSFKSDERAEKRREFYSKLEEKMKAKEEEKNQIQAKSQEELENKMKQLRKSLAFKATPLPSFYQESGPPKVEVKKIPPTRPKSPKLTTSRRTSMVGDHEGSRSPVARIRSDLRSSTLGLHHKSVDLVDDKKAAVRKSMVKLPSMENNAVHPKVNGDGKSETAGKAKPVSVLPSPRKTFNSAVAESRTNRTPQKAETGVAASSNKGSGTNPRRSLHNCGSTDRPKTVEEGKTRSGKPAGGAVKADSKDGVRKSMQWRPKTVGSTARRESLEAEPVKLVIVTPTKGDLTPVVPDVAVA